MSNIWCRKKGGEEGSVEKVDYRGATASKQWWNLHSCSSDSGSPKTWFLRIKEREGGSVEKMDCIGATAPKKRA